MPRCRSAWMGGGRPYRGSDPCFRLEDQRMTTRPGWHQIEVSEEIYDVLARTAKPQGTDMNGAVRYLLELPPVPTASAETDDEE